MTEDGVRVYVTIIERKGNIDNRVQLATVGSVLSPQLQKEVDQVGLSTPPDRSGVIQLISARQLILWEH
jgi:hypothetical protein